MFSQILFVRLRAAEQALRAGRLEEAFRLATNPDIQAHRRGAAILTELTDKLIERARVHFRADRFSEAFVDLERAEAGAREAVPARLGEIAELRQHVHTVSHEARRMADSRRRRLTAARERIDAGSLQAGQDLLASGPADDPDARRIQREVERRRQEAANSAEEARRLLDAGQLAPAVERIKRARGLDPRSETVMTLEASAGARILDEVRTALVDGRTLRALESLAMLGDLGQNTAARRELEQAMETIRAAGAALRHGNLDDARQHALRLQHLLPDAAWVRHSVAQLKQATELMAELTAGPLGSVPEMNPTPEQAARRVDLEETRRVEFRMPAVREGILAAASAASGPTPPWAIPVAAGGLTERLVMLVNGGGSFLLLRGDRITLGRAASDQPADIPIISDLAERHAEIARLDEDYFLLSSRDVTVAGQNTRHQLLRDGDRVVLGRQAKFTFRQPNRKSASAVLDLSDTTRMPGDVRRVVLLKGNATVGFGPSAHIMCNGAERTYVLFERAGTLWIRPQGTGPVQTEARPIELGRTIEIGSLSFVIEPWARRTLPGRLA
jgi:tetratricopeptide (TPR) repeat protein